MGIGEAKIDDAALIVSELLSNALRHAAPLPPPFPTGTVRVCWNIVLVPEEPAANGWIEISVSDGGAETLPRIARPSLSALGGRGLGIVQHLAAKWGTEVDDSTTTVWAVIDIPADEGNVGGHAGTPVETCSRGSDRSGELATSQGMRA
ncbi:hypothetical protein GCM10027294_08020 [Marinactinospora endophytica]|uniref:ATP-binding protein n=1 Tax=Marinactinospora thermotolerans TaxID=531310 RepID=UPI00373FCA82